MPWWKKSKPMPPDDIAQLIEQRHNVSEINTTNTELIVDDNQVNREVLQRYLLKYNYPSEQAYNGLDALKHCIHNNYRIIWIDLMMPVLNGLDTIRYLRAEYPYGFGYTGFIVCVTGFADEDTREKCIEAGADTVLAKPYVGDHIYRLHLHSKCPT